MGEQVTRVGVGVLVCHDGRILIGERRGSHGASTWALPGGHLDFGESVEACAARELEEETGLSLSAVQQLSFTTDFFPESGKHYVTLFVEALDVAGTVETREPDKCAGWHWCQWDALPEPLFAPLRSLRAQGFVPQHRVHARLAR